MREVARWSVFPLMLVAALAVTAVAIARGAPPAAAVFLIYLAMMPIVAGLERALPYRRVWNEGKRDLLTDALYLPTTWGLGALLSPAFVAVAVGVENLAGGMGTAALVAYLSGLCNLAYTATQFALLSAVASIGRTVLAAPAGRLAEMLDCAPFFLVTTLAALPGLALLLWLTLAHRRSAATEKQA